VAAHRQEALDAFREAEAGCLIANSIIAKVQAKAEIVVS
jgi:hypothetical protein